MLNVKKSAQWVLQEGFVECSICGFEPYLVTWEALKAIRYCPGCGRRMCDYYGKPITDKTTTF